MTTRLATLSSALALLLLTLPAQAGDDAVHVGVATCASSVCHGRAGAVEQATVAQNEYRIWAKYDRHARAYQTLKNEQSLAIARKMGLGDPSQAPACLSCHSDYQPAEQRGERFHLEDGVGCEACHGGAEHWLDNHYGEDYSHAKNLSNGLRKTEAPGFAAQICGNCHIGSKNQFANHEMMAAGHPRLRFELDTWLTLMPYHHVVDADYRQRKGNRDTVDRWLSGKLVAAEQYLDLLAHHTQADALLPELAVYDCHSCHRPMRSSDNPAAGITLAPGSLRVNDADLRLLQSIITVRDAKLAQALEAQTASLHRAALQNVAALRQSSQTLKATLSEFAARLSAKPYSRAEKSTLQNALLSAAARGDFRDYADAEQLFLGLQLLAERLGDEQTYQKLFSLLDKEETYSAARIRQEAQRLIDTTPLTRQ